jgi:SAM-dependent methyltransferase
MSNLAQGWQKRYLERFYDRNAGFVDGTQQFHHLCARTASARGRILEIGAGPSNKTSRFLASLGEVHGVDPGDHVLDNDVLASAAVLEGDRLPFADDSFDVCASNYVLEHVSAPHQHLREVRRVLRPGGAYVFRTPNRFHYVAVVAALTPHWFHVLVANRLRRLPPDAYDPFPTFYAMNSRRALHAAARDAGLEVEYLFTVEKEPSYGMSSRALFLLFTAYERLVNRSERLADLRAHIFGVLRKPSA